MLLHGRTKVLLIGEDDSHGLFGIGVGVLDTIVSV
jgi:hypothetical protein